MPSFESTQKMLDILGSEELDNIQNVSIDVNDFDHIYRSKKLVSQLEEEFDISKEELQTTVNNIYTDIEWKPPQPASDNTIWRYINFTQLISILNREKVWFTNTQNFEDPFEGTVPDKNRNGSIQKIQTELDVDDDLAEKIYEIFDPPSAVYDEGLVHCWNIEKHQNAALWEQYLDSHQGVAIKTTVNDLKQSIDQSDGKFIFGKVEYIDYENDTIPHDTIAPIYHKRNSFSHENEYRIFYDAGDSPGKGDYIDVDVNDLIQQIYISPVSQPWFRDLVEDVTEDYGLDCSIKESDIY
jgi:hypothetical protein